ncbi:hypothetical protein SAMN05192529_12124 [Arachidicoccus rhizosphaerae]|jgi:hypothetical protein|uniref:Uncharacterized protein n=2 Tax=Arachidicoccus rhizosphaerae TaxID=551991 RepID=A0A1H4BGR2_9BACT|nr:hypothetical protein SAMN05192529_12124 [Arachidicoccus rhizosphaerae]
MVNLTCPDTCTARATGIFVLGDDIYVSGSETPNTGGGMRAVYWKSGVTHILLDGSEFAQANNICVVDGKVYVAGMVDYYSPAYWVDGKMERIMSLAHVTGFAVR